MTTLFDKLFGIFLGIEFKEDTLVVSFVKNSVSGMSLISSSIFPLKTDDTSLSEIREYINKQVVKPVRVFVSIPDKWAIIKFSDIPFIRGKGKDALVNLLRFEIEKHIPFNIEEVSSDFLVLDEKDSSYSVVFVAVHREKLEYIKDYLEKLSLKPDTIIPSSFAVLNTIELSSVTVGGLLEVMGIARKSKVIGQSGDINVSMYFDRMHSSMAVLKGGIYVYHRSFPYKIEREPGAFYNDISRYMNEILSRFSMEKFNTLILAGDLSNVTDMINELSEKTGSKIITLDQVSDFSLKTSKEDINMLAASVGACFAGLGLATYTINLMPHKMEFRSGKAVPMSTRIFFVLILILVAGIFTTEAVKRKKYISAIEAELKKNEPMVSEIEKLSSDIRRTREQIHVLRNIKKNELTLELLSEISGLIPKDAWITNLEYRIFEPKDKKKGVGELVISGYAASSSALIPVLEDAPQLEKVAFVGPVKKTGDKEQFRLSANIVLPKKEKPLGEDKDGTIKKKTGI